MANKLLNDLPLYLFVLVSQYQLTSSSQLLTFARPVLLIEGFPSQTPLAWLMLLSPFCLQVDATSSELKKIIFGVDFMNACAL